MALNQLIAQGGRNIKSPVQRYMETRAQMNQEQQNRLSQEATRQNMLAQRQQMTMGQQRQRVEMGEAYAKAVMPIVESVNREKDKQAAWSQVYPEIERVASQYNVPLTDQSKTWSQNNADSLINRFGREQITTNYVDGMPVQRSSLTGRETTSPRASQRITQGLYSKIDPSKYTPASLDLFAETKKYSDLVSKPSTLTEGLTVGEEAVDKAIAKDYVAWTTGGFSDIEKSLTQLKSAQQRLESGEENLTGPVIGRISDVIKSTTNPGAVDVKEQVAEVVQRNLRLVLGAQFTEKEGNQLIARAYNENLDEAINAERVGRLIKAIQGAAKEKQKSMDYYSKNGTLKGFKGKQLTINDIEDEMDGRTKNSEEESSGGWSIRKVND